jgi:hypothetical protein
MSRSWKGSSARNRAITSAGDGPRSSIHPGLHVGTDWGLTCHTYADRPPILALDAGQTHITITSVGKTPTADAVEFAWALVAAANDFLIETERLYHAACDAEDDRPDAA